MEIVGMIEPIKVDIYMDEYVRPRKMERNPGIIIFSCQTNVYKKSDIEYNSDAIMSDKSPKLAAMKYMLPLALASSFSYSLELEHGQASWENLSRKVSRNMSKIYQTFGSLGFEIDKIYPCRNVGEKLEKYIRRNPGHVIFGSDILGKIRNDKLDRTHRLREGYDVQYYIKEASGVVARERSDFMMSGIADEIASARRKHRMSQADKYSLFSSIADRYNVESSRIIPTIHMAPPHGMGLENFVKFSSK
jgi:hypothetical protein